MPPFTTPQKRSSSLDNNKHTGPTAYTILSNKLVSLILLLLLIALSSSSFAQQVSNACLVLDASVSKTGTPSFDSGDGPGDDSSASNNIVRTLDSIIYHAKYTTKADLGDPFITMTIPANVEFPELPAICQTGSTIVDNPDFTQTLSCVIPGPISSSTTGFFPFEARVLTVDRAGNYVKQNDTTDASIYFEGSNCAGLTSSAPETIISARPKLDLDKKVINPYLRGVQNDPSGTPGIVYTFPVVVKVSGGKGTEVVIDPINFSDTFVRTDGGPIPFKLFDWHPTIPACHYNYLTGGWNHSGLPRGMYHPTLPERSVTDSGTITCSQAAAGAAVNFSITGADTTGNHIPTRTGGNGAISASDSYLVSDVMHLWVPTQTVEDAGGEIVVKNCYSAITPESVSGAANIEVDTANNCTNNFTIISTRGAFTQYYSESQARRWVTLQPMTNRNSGNGVVMPTQTFGKRIYGLNNGALPWNGALATGGNGFYLCDKIDNRTQVVNSAQQYHNGSNTFNYII